MALSNHYCADCDTHYGGSPNNVTPDEHADIAHDGGFFQGVENGNYKDWERLEDRMEAGLDLEELVDLLMDREIILEN